MQDPVELSLDQCRTLLCSGVVGRVALATGSGPQIVPINYSVVDDAIIMRTSPYSMLGRHGINARAAFEVDQFDHEYQHGWSVVAHGTATPIEDPADFEHIRAIWEPRPWAGGASRNLYLRLAWTELTGRRLGGSWDLMAGLESRRNVG
jgi:nitroimidazol reductase NimA-like FMN-containing flavoprotein (pyridoxamine 5'-phosphate oxidase superfamily)